MVSADGSTASAETSGGGSGGSVFFISDEMDFHGEVHADGGQVGDGREIEGQGGEMGGGGGGGGRIMFQFNASTHTTSQERFDGRYHALGGKQGGQMDGAHNRTHDGADGTVWTSLAPCRPGWGSVFCTECPQGSYKNTTDVSLCVPCENAPEHANYTQRGYVDANCPYECNEGFRGKDCLTPFEEFLRQLGGPVVLIVAFLLVVVVVAIITLVIVQYNSRSGRELPGRNPGAAV